MTKFVVHEVQMLPHRATQHVNAASIEEVLSLLAKYGAKARIIAGGTDLLLEMERRVRPEVEVLVDITRIEGMDAIYEAKGRVHLGPLVTHNQAATSDVVQTSGLPLAQACLEVGSPALRNRATIVGNLVTASPANDAISALGVLDTQISLASERGLRTVSLSDFHTGVRRTVMVEDEMVTGISFGSLSADQRGLYVKLGLRRAQAISVVHLAAVVAVNEANVVTEARLALGSVAPTIVRLPEVESDLVGSTLDSVAIDRAAQTAVAAVTPIGDLRATADYRTDQIRVMVQRALRAIAQGQERAAFPRSIPVLGGPHVEADGVSGTLESGDIITSNINGELTTAPWIGSSLLDWLRDEAGLTGTKEGCAEGECGACTVYLDGTSVLSCLIPAGRAEGAEIVTIEGLGPDESERDNAEEAGSASGDGSLHSLQERFIQAAAVQCGYCIPGFVMAGAALQSDCEQAGSEPTGEELKLGLSGNLCRCTGYYSIEKAVGGQPLNTAGQSKGGQA